jgi:LAO/AO transport system kinase
MLGGVARRTRETILLCEAAQFDVVLVETVGVGQSEVQVAAMVDLFLVLVAPGAGDELQGLKRGIMELADLVVVNKADGELAAAATVTESEYTSALHLVRPRHARWSPRVLRCSALVGDGIDEVWDAVEAFQSALGDDLHTLRSAQAREAMWSDLSEALLQEVRDDRRVAPLARTLEEEVVAGERTPAAAARSILQAFLSDEDAGPRRLRQ